VSYTRSRVRELVSGNAVVSSQINDLILRNVMVGVATADQKTREYLHRGVGRRLNVIQRSLDKIFGFLPPSRRKPLPKAKLAEVRIHLHAFVINLSGIFDCWAWAFVLRHDLLQIVGGPKNVGMFLGRTQRLLPPALYTYVTTEPIKSWHKTYVKSFRDALAHRIPLYIPPAAYTAEDTARFHELEAQKAEFLETRNAEEANLVMDEQDQLGTAAMCFLQELTSDPNSKPVLLHPQVNADAATVVEFGNKFYDQWHLRASP
jgi:hypothetical protein